MTGFSLRLANSIDVDALLAIELACFQSDRLSKRQFRYLLTQAKALTWLIEFDDAVCAYVTVLLPKLPRPARIYSLAVLPAYQCQGLADHLLAHALQEISSLDYKSCVLEVREGDVATIRLYEKNGFTIQKRFKNYYEDKENALRMLRKNDHNAYYEAT